ncbi:MAG TPA: RNA polymerase sigma factor [Polyangia bacterium]|nr:RNA polymerase sigma factor [Polyangia bacterium]
MDSRLFDTALEQHWKRIFNFAFRMTMSRDDAAEITRETYLRAYVGRDKLPHGSDLEPWLLRIANHVIDNRIDSTPEVNFDLLDDTLRSEATRTDVVQSLTHPEKEFLLWELKQGCMTSVVNCLSPGERVAFVLSALLGLDDAAAARTLGIKSSAFKVRLSRARKKVQDYLAPRCEHVDPGNPCHCPSRLGVALSKGFIGRSPSAVVSLRKPAQPFGRYGAGADGDDQPRRDVMRIYNTLPEPDPPDDLPQRIRTEIQSGRWQKLAK